VRKLGKRFGMIIYIFTPNFDRKELSTPLFILKLRHLNMSFQHFRLGELGIGQSVPAHIIQHHIQPQPHSQFSSQNDPSQAPSTSTITTANAKRPYGSGDHEDGYTLVFPSLEAFHAWRQQEEESQMVEFVKGDTHGSKAVPPRFKDHTKLVCARHSRSGRKKYVKKHPERIRKVPSRKVNQSGPCTRKMSSIAIARRPGLYSLYQLQDLF
jgi:hypothetical protein